MNTRTKYVKLLTQRKAMTQNEIRSLVHALNGVKNVNLTGADRDMLRELIRNTEERPITKEQSKLGIAWLRNKAFKLSGEPRKNCILGTFEQSIVNNFSHFKFVGIVDTNPYMSRSVFVPIWRTYARDGRAFDYYISPGSYGGFVLLSIQPIAEKKAV